MRRTIALLLAFIIIGAAIAFASNHDNGKPKAEGTPSQPAISQDDPTAGGNYLYIKDWGVRFKLPPSLAGKLIFTTKDNVDVTLPSSIPDQKVIGDTAYITTDELSALPNSHCKLDLGNGQAGARVFIFRTKQTTPPYDSSDVKLDGYNYVASGGNGGVCSPSSNQSAEEDFISQIVTAYKSLEAVPR